jgi:hypothetical protein
MVQFLKTEYRYPNNAGEVLGLAERFNNSGLGRIKNHGLDLVEFVKTGFLRRASVKSTGERENRGRK